MSRRPNAPYEDQVEDLGRTIILRGHDARKSDAAIPKLVDQPRTTSTGRLTQNGLFEQAALESSRGNRPPEIIRVYEKIHAGIWVFNGTFHLIGAVQIRSGNRAVFKFRLEIVDDTDGDRAPVAALTIPHHRVIPTLVQLEVWQRDKGQCVRCGAVDNLHFDHILPYSRGGASIIAENIQILCARHNLQKGAHIE